MTVTSDSAGEVEQSNLVTVTIDGIEVSVPPDTLVIRAAEMIGVQIPRFCDHPLLDPVGACRQCLVDVPDAGNGRPMPKPQASCTIPVAPGMVINTQATSPVAKKAQEGIMEFLLINHPLDCPVCDKGGECPLQNQSMSNGTAESRYVESKRVYPKPINISAQVLLDRERCVLCARCTRFSSQIAGDPFIELIERGALQQVGIYEKQPFESYFSGNTIQICPVGALTSADYRFRSRPFDLVSTPSVAELDGCGSAIRVDHRRGKVMRRLSGDDPQVNEEWITDKDRFAFTYARQPDRLTHPLVRGDDGELRPASWPEAFVVAARGLAAAQGRVGVLTGGRLTAEDAYAYSKFARVVLGTNDIDFRARAHSAEEASFLASSVVLRQDVTYADLESAGSVVLVALEPEDEAGTIFLRLRKTHLKHRTPIWSVGSHTTAGLRKMGGTLLSAAPGAEVDVVRGLASRTDLALDSSSVLLVGERAVEVPGLLSAVAALAGSTGARLAWVPRRAGDRGALEVGALPNLLPGGRPVADPAARVDLAAAWGVESLPDAEGRDGAGIIEAAATGELTALVVAGVDPGDLPDHHRAVAALDKAFVVSLELRASEVTRAADVVLPVAAATERAGSFVNWEGRVRSFAQVLDKPAALPDLRVLAGIAEEMGVPLGFRTTAHVQGEMASVGPWDGARPQPPTAEPAPVTRTTLVLSSWKQLIDDGRMQDGEDYLRATARRPVVLMGAATLAGLGVAEGDPVTLSGPLGEVTYPAAVSDDIVDGVVWAPASAPGAAVRHLVGSAGSAVSVSSGGATIAKGAEQ
ncbi:NADH-quinone oxidoreductase subunit G [Nocardioides terrisoli]|uniref:NADH-quinone oxidoreductase subunit G n=1 Tax=Nocardioides terrisoli TaxID=3388267 RepID=UPI00287B6089|nr:NADH-quinone oxidoreductase subunit G [Nocardioides marmorisolisilvae]